MAVNHNLSRIAGFATLLIIGSSACAQRLDYSIAELQVLLLKGQESSSNTDDIVIVDHSSTKTSYPSLDEEMAMYVDLKSTESRAFFFPNPSAGVVWIEHNLGKETDLTIADLNGHIVFTEDNLNSRKVGLSAFRPVQYVITLTSPVNSVAKNLLVK